MKILITSDLYTTRTNGVVTSISTLTGELTAMGHEVRILSFSETKESYQRDNVYYMGSASLERVYPNVRRPLRLHHKYVRELIQWKPDVIHSQCEFFSYTFAKQVAKATGAPIVHTYHTLYEQYVPYLLPNQRLGEYVVRTFSRLRLKSAAAVIAPTGKVERTLRGYGLANRVDVIPSGISLEQHAVRLAPEQRSGLRRELGISEEQPVLVNLGRLGNEKNMDELLRLFSQVREEYADLVFLIVGDGPARKGLEQYAAELGIADRVIFTGMVDPGRVHEYYQLADIFVCASTSETQGLTYIEAAANGLPLLCRQDPCLEGVLIPGENGYAYTCDEEFAQSLGKMLGNTAWRSAAGIRSAELAGGFSRDNFGKKVAGLYMGVLEAKVPVTSGA